MKGIGGRVALLGVAVLLALSLAAAAGARHASPAAASGTLTVGLTAGEPDVLDPTLARTFSGREVFLTFCEKLYDLNKRAQIVPQLASALPTTSKNKLTVTIPLRKGIKFNDGTPFNADAVVTTLQRDLTLKGSTRASEISPIDTVAAAGPYKVVIHLKNAYSPLTAQLADRAGMIMSPTQLDKLGANFADNPICVGPYQYQGRVRGDSITVVKSPFYYDKKDVHFASIVFKVENNASAAAAALKAGDLQALDGVAATELSGVAHDPNLKIVTAASLGYQGITFNIGNKDGLGKPYSNVGTSIAASAKLREAFEIAIDKRALNRVVFLGTVLTGCTPLSPASAWFDRSIKCEKFSPARAKQLVQQSGISNPTVHLMVPTGTVALQQAQFVQAEEKDVGINVVIDPTDFVTSLSKADAGTYEAFQIGWSGRVDPDGNIYQFVATDGGQNDSGYSNPRLDLILRNARKATSEHARRTLYHAAQRIMLQDRPLIYLYHNVTRAGIAKNLTGITMYPDTLLRVAFANSK
jgi:peptide/nickel transport system substrate-binding protein